MHDENLSPSSFRADLHCHSTCSDGTATPEELIFLAKKIGLKGLSITDHDTVSAYTSAIPVAAEAGILLGVGIEFSCDFQGYSVHVLGYNFPLEDAGILALCTRHQERRKDRNALMLEKLRRKGLPIDPAELLAHGTVGRPHIAQAMVEKGYVASVREAFQCYLGEGQSCYEKGEPFPVEDALRIIHAAQGKAFLAHPHLYNRQRMIKKLLELPFDGIECYYAKCSPDQERRWRTIAMERGLLLSGGSDFHGSIKPSLPLGCSWVDEAAFYKIFPKKLSISEGER